jgi:putative transposase
MPVFSDSKNAQMLVDTLKVAAGKCHYAVHAFCVMPDHFHALVEGIAPNSDLLRFVRNLKQASTREYSKDRSVPLWQKKFYDHILRPKDSPQAVSWYIWMNPVRKGLCTEPVQYPYSGSFTEDWKKNAQSREVWVPTWKRTSLVRL